VVEAESGAQATFGKHEWIEQEPIAIQPLGPMSGPSTTEAEAEAKGTA
jgi:hypothetical protein